MGNICYCILQENVINLLWRTVLMNWNLSSQSGKCGLWKLVLNLMPFLPEAARHIWTLYSHCYSAVNIVYITGDPVRGKNGQSNTTTVVQHTNNVLCKLLVQHPRQCVTCYHWVCYIAIYIRIYTVQLPNTTFTVYIHRIINFTDRHYLGQCDAVSLVSFLFFLQIGLLTP